MTCILTDEELATLAQNEGWTENWRAIANAAARKALEMAAEECDECREAIRELAGRYK